MLQQSSVAVLIDDPTEKEEVEVKEMFEALRAEMASRDERTSEQFQALRADIVGVEQRTSERLRELREDVKDIRTHVDRRVDDLRQEVRAEIQSVRGEIQDVRKEIRDGRLFKDNRVGLAIAALVGIAVVGTFILQLLDAIF